MAVHKAIFITGGGSGIGRAIAEYFAGRGWFVGLGDVDSAGMKGTQDRIGTGNSYVHKFDVRDRAAWDEALGAFSTAAGGRIDVVANNAGIPLGGSLSENTTEEIERCLDINLKGVLFGAQASLPHLKKTAPGSCLLNTASAAGIYGTGGASVYSATKFGVRGTDRGARCRVGRIRHQGARPDARLHRHAVARPCAQPGQQRGHPQPGYGSRAGDHPARSWSRRPRGTPSTARGCTRWSARPRARWHSARAGCRARCASRRAV